MVNWRYISAIIPVLLLGFVSGLFLIPVIFDDGRGMESAFHVLPFTILNPLILIVLLIAVIAEKKSEMNFKSSLKYVIPFWISQILAFGLIVLSWQLFS